VPIVTRLLPDLLRIRARRLGAEPLVTYYDLSTGERTELSATSMLNWVDKTSNLLVDELMLGVGSLVDLRLARSAPGHWMTLALELAAWQVGAVVRVSEEPGPADLLVLGPDWAEQDRSGAEAVLACSLHPLGLGFPTALEPDVIDFTLEVRGQSDHHAAAPRSPDELAWIDEERRLTHGDLVAVDQEGAAARRLVTVSNPWATVRDAVVVPVLTGGSAVILAGLAADGSDHDRRQRIAETERVDV
jgi:uncharacterized protein (TIGR03089 family)